VVRISTAVDNILGLIPHVKRVLPQHIVSLLHTWMLQDCPYNF